jgi:uncharacterized protein YlxW (UPF0749 family)
MGRDLKVEKQKLIDSLQFNANQLTQNMSNLSKRADLLRNTGLDASATIEEINKAAFEIGRINKAVSDLLHGT